MNKSNLEKLTKNQLITLLLESQNLVKRQQFQYQNLDNLSNKW